VVNPTMDFAGDGTIADHAYWLSDMRVRDPKASHQGTVDVRSEGFGIGDPTPSGTQFSGGALTGGNVPALGYDEQSQTWGKAPAAPAADQLDVTAVNVSTVTIDPRRAHVDCNAVINVVHSDGPLTVVLAGCGGGAARSTLRAAVVGVAAVTSIPNTGGSGGSAAPLLLLSVLGGGVVVARRRRRARSS
jgi:LPXTG-motif cell wall-anchored protein